MYLDGNSIICNRKVAVPNANNPNLARLLWNLGVFLIVMLTKGCILDASFIENKKIKYHG